MEPALLRLYATRVAAEWVDYNGHMNDAAYAVVFSRAIDRLMDFIGLNAAARARTGMTLYTLENHLRYLREVKEGAAIWTTTQLLEHDNKRLRVFHTLYREGDPQALATSEQMLLHVDLDGPAAAPFAVEVAAALARLAQAQADLPMPEQVGRPIRALK